MIACPVEQTGYIGNPARDAATDQPISDDACIGADSLCHDIATAPGPDGRPLAVIDRVNPNDIGEVQSRRSDSVLGENTSKTCDSELESLAAWMELADSCEVIIGPLARDPGIACFQEPNGRIWWAMVTGNSVSNQQSRPSARSAAKAASSPAR